VLNQQLVDSFGTKGSLGVGHLRLTLPQIAADDRFVTNRQDAKRAKGEPGKGANGERVTEPLVAREVDGRLWHRRQLRRYPLTRFP
jgi:hypothetical protein